jgi:predicted metal-dependent phosphoesterase TrpH
MVTRSGFQPAKQFPLGSEWRRWDLHIHTLASVLNNQFGQDWDAYVNQLETAISKHAIAAIGVTDYFTIDGFKQLLEYRAKGRLAS